MTANEPSLDSAAYSKKHGGLSYLQRMMMEKLYKEAAGDPTKLPWHRDEPGPLLVKCATGRPSGRALDVGCGSGVFSRYLASLGYNVIAIDLNAEAVAMARRLSTDGPSFEVIQSDVLEFKAAHDFDLVYDSGCLHNLNRRGVSRYVAQLDHWLAPDGDFVLEHWGKQHALDWRPIGPYRRSQSAISAAFAPQFQLCETASEIIDVPFPLGPKIRGVAFHFKRQ